MKLNMEVRVTSGRGASRREIAFNTPINPGDAHHIDLALKYAGDQIKIGLGLVDAVPGDVPVPEPDA
jgi:hypothetical protein